MTRKKKEIPTQEEIDKLLEEKIKEYEKQRIAWVCMKHKNTYVGFDVCDHITGKAMGYIRKLMELMNVEYAISYPFGDDRKYYIIIEGEDKARADFIQKFIDNGYRLSW